MVASMDQPSREWLGALIKKLDLGSRPIEVAMVFISPAQGAVFAPLALKFVQSRAPIFFRPLTGILC
jgi:hypothetical protein